MCGPAPKLHAPAADGKAACKADEKKHDIRVAKTLEGFRTYPEIKGYYTPGYGIVDNVWMGTGPRCKHCMKKVSLAA
jgi:hypothetical protein